jgi:hypothetical protein
MASANRQCGRLADRDVGGGERHWRRGSGRVGGLEEQQGRSWRSAKIPFDETEAARRLGVGKSTLIRIRAAGQIRSCASVCG